MSDYLDYPVQGYPQLFEPILQHDPLDWARQMLNDFESWWSSVYRASPQDLKNLPTEVIWGELTFYRFLEGMWYVATHAGLKKDNGMYWLQSPINATLRARREVLLEELRQREVLGYHRLMADLGNAKKIAETPQPHSPRSGIEL